MKSNAASAILSALLYLQGLLGFAAVSVIVLKDWIHDEPVFVVGVSPRAADVSR